ncbi:MAG: hypothetical protein R3B70_39665 [Polyangiaceae bacterium]
MIGLRFRETMSGAYHLTAEPGEDRPFWFTVGVGIESVRSILEDSLFTIEGMVHAEGLADHKRLTGTLRIDPLRSKLLVYDFVFEGNDAQKYRFQGKKTLSEGDLLHAMTVLPGAISGPSGDEIATALLRFDLRSDIVRFLRSFRLVRS